MTRRQTTFSLADCAPAEMTLPARPSLDSNGWPEAAIGSPSDTLRADRRGSGVDDPGSIEYDSWSIHLH